MDPDETLQIIMNEVNKIEEGDEIDMIHAAQELRNHFLDLHEWLRMGGYFPKLWMENRDFASDGKIYP